MLREVALPTLFLSCTFGCLADPPTYETPARVPPVVQFSLVDPPPSVVYELAPGEDSMEVTVPFRSEDLRSPVVAKFLIDAAPGREARASRGPFIYDASNFEDETRQIQETVTGLSVLPGCRTLTLLLSNSIGVGDELNDESPATRVMWWVSIPDDEAGDTLLRDCPTLGQQGEAAEQP